MNSNANNRLKKDNEVFKLCFSAIFLSLAIVLELICKVVPILKMPNGGGISIAMLPLIIIAYTFGFKYSIISCIAFGLIDCFLLDGYGFNIFSFILDYIVAFGVISIASIFKNKVKSGSTFYFVLGFVIASVLRWISSGFSGVINAGVWGYDKQFLEGIFGVGNGGMLYLYLYSFIYYNFPYIFASMIASIVCGLIIKKQVFNYLLKDDK